MTGTRQEGSSTLTLGVLVPAYDEEATIGDLLGRLLAVPGIDEVVVVDDGSTDATADVVEGLAARDARLRLVRQPENAGKTAAIQRAIDEATSDILIVQDADLEYDPDEIPEVVAPIRAGRADIAYGSRFLVRRAARVLYYAHYVANKGITTISNVLTNHNMTDVETCYKAFRAPLLKRMRLASRGFGMEVELTALVTKLPVRIVEVPISYYGRTYAEGKKIGVADGLMALVYLLWFNLVAPYTPKGRRYLREVRSDLGLPAPPTGLGITSRSAAAWLLTAPYRVSAGVAPLLGRLGAAANTRAGGIAVLVATFLVGLALQLPLWREALGDGAPHVVSHTIGAVDRWTGAAPGEGAVATLATIALDTPGRAVGLSPGARFVALRVLGHALDLLALAWLLWGVARLRPLAAAAGAFVGAFGLSRMAWESAEPGLGMVAFATFVYGALARWWAAGSGPVLRAPTQRAGAWITLAFSGVGLAVAAQPSHGALALLLVAVACVVALVGHSRREPLVRAVRAAGWFVPGLILALILPVLARDSWQTGGWETVDAAAAASSVPTLDAWWRPGLGLLDGAPVDALAVGLGPLTLLIALAGLFVDRRRLSGPVRGPVVVGIAIAFVAVTSQVMGRGMWSWLPTAVPWLRCVAHPAVATAVLTPLVAFGVARYASRTRNAAWWGLAALVTLAALVEQVV